MFSSSEIKVKLKSVAFELGFDAFGVCSVGDFSDSQKKYFRKWLDGGMNDKMGYLERSFERKISPKSFFVKAKSAICLGANFYRESSEKRIALYAQSKDYHEVLMPKLEVLSKILADVGGEQKMSVDSSVLWEKPLAARAGLGWLGKNTLLIRKENGAWNFIGIILTSLELPFDEPQKNNCGSCDACVRACPTQALKSCDIDGQNFPYLDSRACISNLTIERKGDLNDSEKNIVGDKIFGCDECLGACPFGKSAPITKIEEFRRTINLPENPSRNEIVDVSIGTPMSRKYKS